MNDPSPRQDDDRQIKTLLLSPNEAERQAGMVRLAAKYRDEVCGYVRYWSNVCRAAFAAQDLPDVWQEVLCCVWKNVKEQRLDANGSLRAYLKSIAHHRAVDKLRRRALVLCPSPPDVPALEGGMDDLLEAIVGCYGSLSENEQLVLRVDVKLFYQEFKWVPNSQLTEEVNAEFGLSLDEEAVKSRRYRARHKLRACLRNRGYQW